MKIGHYLLMILPVHLCEGGLLSPEEFDFIIVGGGAAGCLLANRLSQNPNWKILLLEAGREENFIQDIPLTSPALLLSPGTWGYKSEPSSKFALGLKGGQMLWSQGKVLGGGSVVNDMVYTRGNRKDFDSWEEMGNTGWGYDSILPYFLKFEKMRIPELAGDKEYHSTNGSIPVMYPPFHTEMSTAYIEAGVELGYKEVDYNGKNQIGFSRLQTILNNGEKFSANKAFIKPISNRRNLKVIIQSTVTNILIDESKKAYGVQYRMFSILPVEARAKKEVIITAGTFNSAQLLMISGIGPREHLLEKDIPVIQDLKVGYNFKDHVSFLNLFFTVNRSVSIELRNFKSIAVSVGQYLTSREGEFTVPSGFEALSYVDIGDEDGFPEVELYFGGFVLPSIPFYLSPFGVLNSELSKFYEPLKTAHGFTILPILLRPQSSGRVILKDKSPFTLPLLYPDFFSDERDIKVLINATKKVFEIIQTKSLQSLNASIFAEKIPPCQSHYFGSDDYWECAIRFLTMTTLHSVGTCKMGPDSDPDAVVDPQLRVRGIKNLRVVGAAIMPQTPSGHSLAAVYMIAEKAADLIKSYWSIT